MCSLDNSLEMTRWVTSSCQVNPAETWELEFENPGILVHWPRATFNIQIPSHITNKQM